MGILQLLKLRCDDVPELERWLSEGNYLSHELITSLGNTLLHKLLGSIREANWFAVMADETRDISNN